MDIAIQEQPKIDVSRRVEEIISNMAGARFDNLIDLRDFTQALIDREKDKHEQELKAKADALRKQLAEHTAKLNNLDSRVRAKSKATRSDAGKPRVKKAAESKG